MPEINFAARLDVDYRRVGFDARAQHQAGLGEGVGVLKVIDADNQVLEVARRSAADELERIS